MEKKNTHKKHIYVIASACVGSIPNVNTSFFWFCEERRYEFKSK